MKKQTKMCTNFFNEQMLQTEVKKIELLLLTTVVYNCCEQQLTFWNKFVNKICQQKLWTKFVKNGEQNKRKLDTKIENKICEQQFLIAVGNKDRGSKQGNSNPALNPSNISTP